MKLTDLDPRWLMLNSERVGLIFKSPISPKFRQTCFFVKLPKFTCAKCCNPKVWACEHSQMGVIARSCPDLADQEGWGVNVQLCRHDFAWRCEPGPAYAKFETITVKPSIDGSAGGLWHGFITAGRIVGGLGGK